MKINSIGNCLYANQNRQVKKQNTVPRQELSQDTVSFGFRLPKVIGLNPEAIKIRNLESVMKELDQELNLLNKRILRKEIIPQEETSLWENRIKAIMSHSQFFEGPSNRYDIPSFIIQYSKQPFMPLGEKFLTDIYHFCNGKKLSVLFNTILENAYKKNPTEAFKGYKNVFQSALEGKDNGIFEKINPPYNDNFNILGKFYQISELREEVKKLISKGLKNENTDSPIRRSIEQLLNTGLKDNFLANKIPKYQL
jgi:hypothetical protein